jgi:dihydrofolate reductase
MRRIIAGLFVTLDGVMEAPEDWQFPYWSDEEAEAVGAQLMTAETLLLGRRTYEIFAASWPQRGSEVPFADKLNSMPKVVVSSTLDRAEWSNTTVLRGDVAREVAALKRQPGGDVAISGSATLVRSLLRDRLLDELRLLVHPIVLGKGARLFQDGDHVPLRLLDSKAFGTGVLSLAYGPAEG